MGFPSINVADQEEVGWTGLLWLFLSYGYVLYYASNLISEGSDLLMLIPSMAGLVGGVVLPLLGAVPDGAIMLFSGLGSRAKAQRTLSVGVGALAGSTISLLTVPIFLTIWGGRVNYDESGNPNYKAFPRLTKKGSLRAELLRTGVAITEQVNSGARIMLLTTIPYFIIQVPAFFLKGRDRSIAHGEKWFALAGFVVCILFFASYLYLQVLQSKQGVDKDKRVAVVKKLLLDGEVSLCGALSATVRGQEELLNQPSNISEDGYASIETEENKNQPPEPVRSYLKEVLREAFSRYDVNGNGTLDLKEVKTFFRDFHEDISDDEVATLFARYDTDGDQILSFEEFINACYVFIKEHDKQEASKARRSGRAMAASKADSPPEGDAENELVDNMFSEEHTEEVEEVPEDFTELSPDEQQAAIKRRAFVMLFFGTLLVVVFSDPMVQVFDQIAVRLGLSPFYVSFVLAPIASNASEVIASMYYAAKKTRKTVTVALTALEGAASMNNTFCLSIFMGLIFFRGLAWTYTSETISILTVELVIFLFLQGKTMNFLGGFGILAVFPLSLVYVAFLEWIGLK
eukprot:CAMPEP_0116825680 /NCGR_PEP_ID=MMETSP0418-20121206/2103_1 /TAXON_ID=1158023 /ORGANISM="Astrosyne radiata, Strain 13vi08-1A" /LENGTH=572 /DNA_ID=CAMNT_0004454221 /DNA_START=109 /DNA_END=1827 /DNA_ORIENTATION=+